MLLHTIHLYAYEIVFNQVAKIKLVPKGCSIWYSKTKHLTYLRGLTYWWPVSSRYYVNELEGALFKYESPVLFFFVGKHWVEYQSLCGNYLWTSTRQNRKRFIKTQKRKFALLFYFRNRYTHIFTRNGIVWPPSGRNSIFFHKYISVWQFEVLKFTFE